MGANERLDLANLSESAGEFTELRILDERGVVMVAPPVDARDWARTCELWRGLPRHPNLLELVDRAADGALLVRFAAIDWRHEPLSIDEPWTVKRVATWGMQLAEVAELIAAGVPVAEAGLVSNICAHVDLDGQIRIAFDPASPDPPLAVEPWPACDERGLVLVVGRALSGLFTGEHRPLDAIVRRCMAASPGRRFQTLVELKGALAKLGDQAVRDQTTWNHVELAIGLLQLGNTGLAAEQFQKAIDRDPRAWLALAGRRRIGSVAHEQPVRRSLLAWTAIEREASKLESQRAFGEALALYRQTNLDGSHDCELHVARARCHLHLGEGGLAVDYAQRALALEPERIESLAICASGFLLRAKYDDALRICDRWLALGIDVAGAHYRRGKALLALKRLTEARDAFDRALTADGRLVPAMLLRREADRLLRDVRAATGVQRPIEIDLPEHLSALAPMFATGRIEDALAALSAHDDPHARLVSARCLEFVRRFGEAAEVYARVASEAPELRHAALLGRAAMLVELGDPDGALVIYDELRAQRPDDLDVIEGRAWALDRLGRTDESAAEFRRYVALNQGRSDRRVRLRGST